MSIVIATRNRPSLLSRCLAHLCPQLGAGGEVIVVDDGSSPPLRQLDVCTQIAPGQVQMVRTPGVGPGRARNVGWRLATAPYVLFTDDDVIPSEDWVAKAMALVDQGAADLIEGRTVTEHWDPLFQHTAAADGPGHFLTCNMLMRRQLLERLGGFDGGFPYPHCEDRDLGLRASKVGTTCYAPEMVVYHPPRAIRVGALIRRATWLRSEHRLMVRHPQLRYGAPDRILWLLPFVGLLRNLIAMATCPRHMTVRTALRLGVVMVGQTIVGLVATAAILAGGQVRAGVSNQALSR